MANLDLSIHGKHRSGKQAGQNSGLKYNPAPQESEISNSPRAVRRRNRKTNKK